MISYWILPHPGVNAVFFDASEGLAMAELSLCMTKLETPCGHARVLQEAGMRWYAFDAERTLTDMDIRKISGLSCLYALFEQAGGLLRPIQMPQDAPFGDDLSAILKYTGKTNALFTRMMLHIAALSLPVEPQNRPIRLLDPVAGKGTTLFEGLMRGWDVTGVEIVHKAAHESAVYFQKYLETEKWRHKLQKMKNNGAYSWMFTFARDKDALKENPGRLTMIAGDSKLSDTFLGKAAFDIVCGDLPYGVAHGNITGGNLNRSPGGLLRACLPAWHRVLKKGGVLALSWNTLVYSTVDMRELLQAHGFTCLTDPPYDALAHRVDASIRRDIVVAIKAGPN